MTTFILHGGKTSRDSEQNEKFYSEFTNIEKDTVTILLCYWARDKEKWSALEERDKAKITQNAKGKHVVFEMAEHAEDFVTKVKSADVVYIAGGTYLKLYEEFQKIENIQDLFQDKIIIGSSAGAFLLCKYSLNSFDSQPGEINTGLGLLGANVLCHWDIEMKKTEKIKKIKEYDFGTPIFLIDEADYVKITI